MRDRRYDLLAALLVLTGFIPRLCWGAEPDPAQLDAIFTAVSGGDTPGCAVGASRDGKPLFLQGYGRASLEHDLPITPQTTFNLGSVSKQFTALAALMLEKQGRLDLDARIGRYVPGLPMCMDNIRVQDLLQHTSGLRDYSTLAQLADRPVRTMDDFLDLMNRQRGLNFQPGTLHQYSHSDYTMLAIVLERITGEPLGQFLEREIFQPLGMMFTSVHDARGLPVKNQALTYAQRDGKFAVRFPNNELVGGNNVYSCVEDLLKWEQNSYTGQVGGLDLVRRLTERPKLASGATIPYAFGLRLGEHRGLPTVYRGGAGGGFSVEVMRFPQQQFSVVVLCNRSEQHPGRLCMAVADLYLSSDFKTTQSGDEPGIVPVPPEDLLRLPGIYRPPGDPWDYSRIIARDGKLVEQYLDDTYPVERLSDGKYRSDGMTLRFDPGTGRPERLVLSVDGQDEVLERAPDNALPQLTAEQLAGYAGTFLSRELETTWDLRVENGTLMLVRPGHAATPMFPAEKDVFLVGTTGSDGALSFGVSFKRDAAGTTSGFTVTATPSFAVVRNIGFERVVHR